MDNSKLDKSVMNDSSSAPVGKTSKEKIKDFLDSTGFTLFISFVTLYALFGDDIRILVVDKDGDPYFYVVTAVCLVLFFVEIFMSCYCKKDYMFSFFFYLDVVSTASLLFDIGWFSELIFPTADSSANNSESAEQLAKAAQASRIGTRAARVIRIIRLIRLIRIVKLYKASQKDMEDEDHHDSKKQQMKNKKEEKKVGSVAPKNLNFDSDKKQGSHQQIEEDEFQRKAREKQEKNLEQIMKETEVGKKLTGKITKIVIVLILMIMLSIPIFTVETYYAEYAVQDSGMKSLGYLLNEPEGALFKASFDAYYDEFKNFEPQIVYLALTKDSGNGNPTVIYEEGSLDTLEGLRDDEKTLYSASQTVGSDEYLIIAQFKSRKTAIIGACLGLGRTIFVCFVLAGSSIMLSNDSEQLVISPIEQMLRKVNRISDNPLEAAKEEEKEALEWEKIMKQDKATRMAKMEQARYEPSVLEKVIMKIGALLAIGFGEAGSDIIAENMKNSGSIDPMLPGVKVFAVFGFCDIRYFAEVTEILKKDIMVFVNGIAEIVHGIVDQNLGAANKNIGDAFLLVWKVPQEELYVNDGQLTSKGNLKTEMLADLAIYSFLCVIAEIQKNQKVRAYSDNEALKQHMGGSYKVKMGFGLHIGWSIEGAIGSKYKIDASYLSPNVNMAARLEAATKQFGVTLLISGPLERFTSVAFKNIMRKIDKVTVKGSLKPIELFTIDLDVDKLGIHYVDQEEVPTDPAEKRKFALQKRKKKVAAKKRRDKMKQDILTKRVKTYMILENNDDIKQMRESFTDEFFETWKKGMENYLGGNWDKALEIFKETKTMLPGLVDGPSQTLISVIERNNGVAPGDWKGYRPLTSK